MHRNFSRDLVLVILGQIISLFGNCILRFALPLYILDQSGSPALFGLVSAVAFLPMIIMSPVGGIIADRVNKQRIMVALDFFTAILVGVFIALSGHVSMVPLVVGVMMLLYGIQGAYSPAVQASLPLLVDAEQLVAANAAVNLVNSLSSLLGPVIGGILYANYGLMPILYVSVACFALSAIMELFIRIPHKKRRHTGSVWSLIRGDMGESLRFIFVETPLMAKIIGIIVAINLFFSAMVVIGYPVLITGTLGLNEIYYGYAEGVIALGGLAGGLLAGTLGNRIKMERYWILILISALSLVPIGMALFFQLPVFSTYIILCAMGFLMMIASTTFSILMLVMAQTITPQVILGKVISCVMAMSLCAQPLGQALYGLLFERLSGAPWIIILGCSLLSLLVSFYSRGAFGELPSVVKASRQGNA